MSYFSSFGKVGLDLLNQVGSIVAPVEEEGEIHLQERSRDAPIATNVYSQPHVDSATFATVIEPESPTSMIDVDLNSEKSSNSPKHHSLQFSDEHLVEDQLDSVKKTISFSPSIANTEPEKKIQEAYRASIENELSQNEVRFQRLSRESREDKETIERLQRELQLKSRANKDGTNSRNVENDEAASLNVELLRLRTQLQKERTVNEEMATKVTSLNSMLEKMAVDHEALEHRIASKNKESRGIQEKIEGLEEASAVLLDRCRQKDDRIAHLESALHEEKQLSEKMSMRVAELEEDLNRALTRLERNHEIFPNCNDKVSDQGHAAAQAQLMLQLEEQREENKLLLIESSEYKRQLEQEKQSLRDLRRQQAERTQEFQEMQTSHERLEARISVFSAEVDRLTSSLEKQARERSELEQKMIRLRQESEERAGALRDKVAENERICEELNENLRRKHEELETVRRQHHDEVASTRLPVDMKPALLVHTGPFDDLDALACSLAVVVVDQHKRLHQLAYPHKISSYQCPLEPTILNEITRPHQPTARHLSFGDVVFVSQELTTATISLEKNLERLTAKETQLRELIMKHIAELSNGEISSEDVSAPSGNLATLLNTLVQQYSLKLTHYKNQAFVSKPRDEPVEPPAKSNAPSGLQDQIVALHLRLADSDKHRQAEIEISRKLTEQLEQIKSAMATLEADHLAVLSTQEARIASLMREKDQISVNSSSFLKQKEELEQLQRELQRVRAAAERESHAAAQQLNELKSQLSNAKQQTQTFETQNRQLHQVIAQLRQVRRNNKEDADTIQQERDELKQKIAAMDEELTRLSYVASLGSEESQQLGVLRTEYAAAQQRLSQVEQLYVQAIAKVSQLEKELYDAKAAAEVLRSDALLLKSDLTQRNIEYRNVHKALEHMEKEKQRMLARITEDCNQKIEQMQQRLRKELEQSEDFWKEKLQQELQNRQTIVQKCEDEALLRRKMEYELNLEKKRMHKTLEAALAQLKNSQQDVIDRTLISNLIVSYFKRNRSTDVLQLISKVLSFTDDQKEAVGLTASKNFVASLFSAIISPPAPPPDIEGENLAEMWVNFLMSETDASAKIGSSSVGHTPKSSKPSPRNVSVDSDSSSTSSSSFFPSTLGLTPSSSPHPPGPNGTPGSPSVQERWQFNFSAPPNTASAVSTARPAPIQTESLSEDSMSRGGMDFTLVPESPKFVQR